MPEPILKVEDVHTYYGPLHVLKGVNYDLYEGEIVCLLGGNASGKSTTMKTVLGLVKPVQGQVVFAGERIDRLDTSQIIELAGCDLLTISPELMKELSESTEPVERKLIPEKSKAAQIAATPQIKLTVPPGVKRPAPGEVQPTP